MRVGYPIYEPVSKSENLPYFPPNTVDWYFASAQGDTADWRRFVIFNIVTNFNWEGRRTIRIPVPDTNWYFGMYNSWTMSGSRPYMAVGPGGVIYLQLSFHARSERDHDYTAPFTAEELRARNASGLYRLDTSGTGLVQLVRQWSGNLGISITADGEKIYYGFLKPDSTCAIFEMDKCGRNKRQVSFRGEGLSSVANRLPDRSPSALEVRCEPAVVSAGEPVVVRYDGAAPGPIDVTLYDQRGQVVYRRHEPGAAGPDATLIESHTLSAGVYTVVVESAGRKGAARVVVLR